MRAEGRLLAGEGALTRPRGHRRAGPRVLIGLLAIGGATPAVSQAEEPQAPGEEAYANSPLEENESPATPEDLAPPESDALADSEPPPPPPPPVAPAPPPEPAPAVPVPPSRASGARGGSGAAARAGAASGPGCATAARAGRSRGRAATGSGRARAQDRAEAARCPRRASPGARPGGRAVPDPGTGGRVPGARAAGATDGARSRGAGPGWLGQGPRGRGRRNPLADSPRPLGPWRLGRRGGA